MDEKKQAEVSLPAPLVEVQTPFKIPVIKWEKGKGTTVQMEPFVFEFPPRLLHFIFRKD